MFQQRKDIGEKEIRIWISLSQFYDNLAPLMSVERNHIPLTKTSTPTPSSLHAQSHASNYELITRVQVPDATIMRCFILSQVYSDWCATLCIKVMTRITFMQNALSTGIFEAQVGGIAISAYRLSNKKNSCVVNLSVLPLLLVLNKR